MATCSILNDVMGPVMRGPSSSHTAGAFRIGKIARMLAGEQPARIRIGFDPSGSYAPTYHAMGVDAAFAAAFLDMDMTDARYPSAPELAAQQGIEISFVIEPLAHNDHPNTIRLEITTRNGASHVMWARSIGGGMIDVYNFDDWDCRIDGKSWVLLLKSCDAADAWRSASGELGGLPPTISNERAKSIFAQWDLPDPPAEGVLRKLRALPSVTDVRSAKPLMHVLKGMPRFASAREMLKCASSNDWSLGKAACAYEAALLGIPETEVLAEVLRRFEIMRASAADGLDDSRVTMPLLTPSASKLWKAQQEGRLPHGGMLSRAVARSLAVLHVCNSKGVVCAAPTGGSSGVLPGVLVTLREERNLDDQQTAKSFLAAGAVGLVMAQRATFAAEEAGCQVEIGVAGAMAAAAVVESAGGSAVQAASAASIALQNTMGMVCDPVDGGCEIPCHTRTAAAVAQAFVCADLVLGGYDNPISLDDAVDASYAVGKQLPASLRCTAKGGIAVTPSARALVAAKIVGSKQKGGRVSHSIRFFSAEDVTQLVSVKEAIPLVREAFIQLSSKKACVPLRTKIDVPAHDGTVLYMPAYLPGAELLVVKVVSLFSHNPAKGLPLIHALVMVNDASTGRPLAVMDGERLTAVRTAAASGVATDLLARRDAAVAAIFGAGVQGRAQLEAVCAVRTIRKAYVFDADAARAEAYCREMAEKLSLEVVAARSPSVLREVDVVCTVTTSRTPVFAHADVKPGAHINAIGAYKPAEREIPGETVCAARLVVDQRESCLAEAGDIVIPLRNGLITSEHISAEIGEIAAGQKPGRSSQNEITLFKSVGNAVQDAAVAAKVIEKAHNKFGTEVQV
ncbi:MAG TPA: L-serine ammonia-lyase, iron-sulfur-dependent, subunit alpha [Planctomycetota bacterium]|jgi:L-serine dehydratase